ncbi:MAG: hypothetical protein RLY86_668 [Pseudomonadota bacterium]|jgi:hypothetical protein
MDQNTTNLVKDQSAGLADALRVAARQFADANGGKMRPDVLLSGILNFYIASTAAMAAMQGPAALKAANVGLDIARDSIKSLADKGMVKETTVLLTSPPATDHRQSIREHGGVPVDSPWGAALDGFIAAFGAACETAQMTEWSEAESLLVTACAHIMAQEAGIDDAALRDRALYLGKSVASLAVKLRAECRAQGWELLHPAGRA